MACTATQIRSGALVIRAEGSDTGDRPREPCGAFWLSPDVYLVGSIVDRTTARVGGAVRVAIAVRNRGGSPISEISVEAWICDYTAGPLPTGQLLPPGRMTGFRLAPIPAGAPAEIVCDQAWTPTSGQLALNGGHVCIAANVWAQDVDGRELGGGVILPCCDSHHAQRNIAIVAASGGARLRQMIRLAPPPEFKEELPVLLEFFPNTSREAFGPTERDQLEHSIWAKRLKFGEPVEGSPKAATLSGKGFAGDPRVEAVLSPGRPLEVALEVEVEKGMRPGDIQVFDAVTRDRKTDEVIGGARLLVLAVPDDVELGGPTTAA